jgi:hypothetical protein
MTQDKINPLEVSVTVVESPANIGSKMFEIFNQCGWVERRKGDCKFLV